MESTLHDPQFWVAIAFVVFVAIVVWKAKKPVLDTLDGRAERIRNQLDEAQRLREEAQHMLADFQRKQRQAMEEAEQILGQARASAERHREQAAQDLDASLKRREQQAMDRIAQAEAEALSEVRAVAISVAVDATRKLLAESVDEKLAGKLVDNAIKDLPDKLH
ncbi:MAG: F0F1 ATP synthase subunit B [Rhodospirillaceae bacterium]|jgi:F-type H+-transporting ATPase subunit b|nr:F0F1 ATP synthase subunit B [Rhodospirillaceae bacterium]MBT6117342.1 F0F1 ATP synthase subunit B [Rhodospirillaceae bacterium]